MANAQVQDSSLPPPEPPDHPGTRPPTDLVRVAEMVRWIQAKLARERAEKAEKQA